MSAKTPEDIHARMAVAFNEADVDAFVDLHEEGAVTIPPHTGEPATGHAEIRTSIEPIFAMRPKLTNRVLRKIERDGLALTFARWRLTGVDSDAQPVEMEGEGTVVSRRQPDGAWRIVMESPSRPH
jgi:ketosteroid isomerase-like protein